MAGISSMSDNIFWSKGHVDKSAELRVAIQSDDLSTLLKLLQKREINPNHSDAEGRTPLHWAVQHRDLMMLIALLSSKNIDPNCVDTQGITPLQQAAQAGYLPFVTALLNHDHIAPEKKDVHGVSALQWAAGNGGYDRWNTNHGGHSSGGRDRKPSVLQALLSHPKTDINQADKDGDTALKWAIQGRHWPAVQILINCADIEILPVDRYGHTPFDDLRLHAPLQLVHTFLMHPHWGRSQ